MQNLIDLADLLGVEMRDLWDGPNVLPATEEQRMMLELMMNMTVEEQQTWVATTATVFRKGASK